MYILWFEWSLSNFDFRCILLLLHVNRYTVQWMASRVNWLIFGVIHAYAIFYSHTMGAISVTILNIKPEILQIRLKTLSIQSLNYCIKNCIKIKHLFPNLYSVFYTVCSTYYWIIACTELQGGSFVVKMQTDGHYIYSAVD